MSENTLKKQDNDVVDIHTPLILLALPVFAQALLALLIGYVDTLMLTKYSETAVGAVGNANQILGFLTLAFTIISSATGVIVSQYLGARETKKISKIYTLSIVFNLALSVTVSILIFVGSKAMLSMVQLPEELFPDAVSYMKIVGGMIFLQAMIEVFIQILRSNGKLVFGMLISLLMNIINIVGNYLFLYGPLSNIVTGASGVAVSSVISRFIGIIVFAVYFHFKIDGEIALRHLKPFPADILKKLLKLGVPTAGENISYNISQIIITAMVNTLGTITINTKIYCGILTNFSYLYSISVAMATQIIVGHAVGAGKYDFAYKRVIRSLIPAEIISVLIATANYLLSPITLNIFTDNAETVALGQQIMLIAVALEIGRTCNLVVINSMRASGDVKFPTILGICSMWGVSVVFSYILGIFFGLGLKGFWIAMAADEILRGIVVLIRWQKGSWRNRSVIEKQ